MKRVQTVTMFVGLGLLTVLTYWGLWETYFQQDEWNGFGKVIYATHFGWMSLVRIYGSHFTPLSSLFFAFLYSVFGLNSSLYGLYSIALHMLNSFMIFFLAKYTFKKNITALIVSGLFAVAFVSRQAVLWFAASPSFLPAAFFVLLGLVSFEKYLNSLKRVYLVGSIGCVLCGLGFRENVIFLLGYFIIRSYLVNRRLLKIVFRYSLAAGLPYLLVRFYPYIFFSNTSNTGSYHLSLSDSLIQAVEFFFVSPAQMVIPRITGITLGRFFFNQQFVTIPFVTHALNVPVFIETVFIRIFYACLWILGAMFIFRTAKKVKHDKNATTLLRSFVVFIPLSILPFSFLPRSLFMESRHFYVPMIGFSLLIGQLWEIYAKSMSARMKACLLFFLMLLILANAKGVHNTITASIPTSKSRASRTQQLLELYPVLPSRSIFYREGDALSRQLGSGYMVMVLYHDRQPYYPFLKQDFLWNLGSQGYKEEDNIGFGYFREYDKLLDTYCREGLSKENVFSFSWDESEENLTDTTEQTRAKLKCNYEA